MHRAMAAAVPEPGVVFSAGPQHGLTDDAIAFVRRKFPNLSDYPDSIVRGMSFDTIHTLDRQIGSQSEAQKKAEPSERVLHNLNELQKNPTIVPAGTDDRNNNLHPARFLGGPVCSSQQLWKKARENLGPLGVEPLANFYLRSVGLRGHVTTRG
jgi:hypothetical protein